MCSEGSCGACMVHATKIHPVSREPMSVNLNSVSDLWFEKLIVNLFPKLLVSDAGLLLPWDGYYNDRGNWIDS